MKALAAVVLAVSSPWWWRRVRDWLRRRRPLIPPAPRLPGWALAQVSGRRLDPYPWRTATHPPIGAH